jgi:hypothetical protein
MSGSELSVSEKSGIHETLIGFAFCADVYGTSTTGAALHSRRFFGLDVFSA